MSSYQSMHNSPEGGDHYFLARPKDISPRLGRPWIPTVVRRIGDAVYTTTNELDALLWSVDPGDISKGCTANVFMANLEWAPLPDGDY